MTIHDDHLYHGAALIQIAVMQSSPLGGTMKEMTGGAKLEPGMPTATKYSLIFAVLSGFGGVVCMVVAAQIGPGGAPKKHRGHPEAKVIYHAVVGGSQ